MTAPKSDLPQGTLDLLILKVVALGPLHGYAIAQRLQQVSREVVQVQQGTLYPALHRLENRGYLSAEWKMSDTGRVGQVLQADPEGPRAHGERSRELAPPDRSDRLHPEVGRRRGAMSWWARLIRRRRVEAQLDAELRDHVERQVADYVRAGHERAGGAPAHARRVRRPRPGQGTVPRRSRGTRLIEELAPGYPVRLSRPQEEPGLHDRCDHLAGSRHRREHRDLQPHRRGDA